MTNSTTFTQGTTITSAWLNDVNTKTFNDDASTVSYTPAGIGAVTTTVDVILNDTIRATHFGASPSNTAAQNDTAFQKASAAIELQGGGTLVIKPGIYQTNHQVFGSGSAAYLNSDCINIQNCTRHVRIEAYGVKFVMPDGQHFGSFDPVTGLPYTPGALPFWNGLYAGHPGHFIYLKNNSGGVSVCGIELDGNNTKYIVGGNYGDTGYQVRGNGIECDGNASARIEDVWVHNCGLDGINLKNGSLSATSVSKPVLLTNVNSEYNCRQGLSHEGGIGFKAVSCKFNHTGRAVNVNTGTALLSSPTAGVDIEPVAGTISRELEFNRCEFVNNYAYGLAAASPVDASTATFNDCLFWGVTSLSMYVTYPYFIFNRCRIYGRMATGSFVDRREGSKFYNCQIIDQAYSDGNVSGKNSNVFLVTAGTYVAFKDCQITANYMKLASVQNTTIDGCVFMQIYNGLPDKTAVLDVRGALMRSNVIIDNVTVPTANGYYVDIDYAQQFINKNEIIYVGSANYLKWLTWDASAGGFQGVYGSQQTPATQAARSLTIYKELGRNNYVTSINVYTKSSMPTTGTYVKGDVVTNCEPAIGSPKGWRRLVSGSAHVLGVDWASEGNL